MLNLTKTGIDLNSINKKLYIMSWNALMRIALTSDEKHCLI